MYLFKKKKIKILFKKFLQSSNILKKGEKITQRAGLSPFSSKFQEIILFLGFRNSEHVKKQLARRSRARNAGGKIDIRPDEPNVFICKVEEQIPFVVSSLQSLNRRTSSFSQIRAQNPKMATFHKAIFPTPPSWVKLETFLEFPWPDRCLLHSCVFTACCQFASALG